MISINPTVWHTPATPTCKRVPHCCGLINLLVTLASEAPRLTQQFLRAIIPLRSSSTIHLTALLAAGLWIWTWPMGRDSLVCGRRWLPRVRFLVAVSRAVVTYSPRLLGGAFASPHQLDWTVPRGVMGHNNFDPTRLQELVDDCSNHGEGRTCGLL